MALSLVLVLFAFGSLSRSSTFLLQPPRDWFDSINNFWPISHFISLYAKRPLSYHHLFRKLGDPFKICLPLSGWEASHTPWPPFVKKTGLRMISLDTSPLGRLQSKETFISSFVSFFGISSTSSLLILAATDSLFLKTDQFVLIQMYIFELVFYAQPVQFLMQNARDHDIFADPSENQIFENASFSEIFFGEEVATDMWIFPWLGFLNTSLIDHSLRVCSLMGLEM